MSLSFCKRWAKILAVKTGQSSENEAILAFVMELFFVNMINLTIIILLGLFFNILPSIIACLVTIALLRFTAGGAHSNSPWRCAAITAIVFLVIALIASSLSLIDQLYTNMLAALAIVIALITVFRYAPVDSPSAPIQSAIRRKRLRFLSRIAVTLIAATIIFLNWSTWTYAREVQAAMTLCLMWTSFNLTIPGHRLMHLIDRIQIPKEKEVH